MPKWKHIDDTCTFGSTRGVLERPYDKTAWRKEHLPTLSGRVSTDVSDHVHYVYVFVLPEGRILSSSYPGGWVGPQVAD